MKKEISRQDLVHLITIFLMANLIFGFYIAFAAYNRFPNLALMVEGSAARPFAYRVMPSLLIGFISRAFGISYFPSAVVVMYISMLGFSFSMLPLARLFLAPLAARYASLLAPFGLIPFLVFQRHIYDLPILFLFTLSLYLLSTHQYTAYIFTFTCTALTKETAFFLIAFSLLQFSNKMKPRAFILFLGIQTGIYFIIRLGLIYIFQDNPGTLIEAHFSDHVQAYLRHPWLAISSALFLMIPGVVLFLPKNEKSDFLRNALLAIGIPTAVLYIYGGEPFEIRIFLEVYSMAFLVVAIFIQRVIPPKRGSVPDSSQNLSDSS